MKILEAQDGRLPQSQQAALESHLRVCSSCRELAASYRALDASLSRALRPPVLADGFEARLTKRIQNEPSAAAGRFERREALQAEFMAGRARLGRVGLRASVWIERLTYVAAVSLGWLLVARLGPGLAEAADLPLALGRADQGIWLLLMGGLCLGFGLWVAFPRGLTRLWSALE